MVEAGSQAKKKIKLMEFKHPKYYKELKEFGKRGDRGKPTAASPDTDQVISSRNAATVAGRRAPGPGLKPQDNNASFEGISEAEYNKRHMKALKDADPGVKLSSTQAFEPTYAVRKPTSNGLKLQARGHKLQDPVTRVQAHKLRVRGSGYEDK